MGSVIGDLLPLAAGVAVSPIPIVAAILMVLSKHAGGAAKRFAVGWVGGILIVTVVMTLLAGVLGESTDRQPSAVASWVKIVLGAGLVVLAVKQWRSRSDTTVPAWMQAIETVTVTKAAGLGLMLSAANPKHLLLCAAAGVAIGAGGLSTSGDIVAIGVFTLLCSATVLTVVLGSAVAADTLRPTLDSTRQWLQANNSAVMAVVLLVMGAVVVGEGIGGL